MRQETFRPLTSLRGPGLLCQKGKNRGFPDPTLARVGAKGLPSENSRETPGSEERKEDW